jgi:hypothetical protein
MYILSGGPPEQGGAPNSRTFAAGLLRKHAEEEHKTVAIPFRMMSPISPVWFHQSKEAIHNLID